MRRCFGNRFCAVVVFAGPVAASFGQPIPSSRQSPPVAETSSQNATPSQEKQAAVAEAARKAKERSEERRVGKECRSGELEVAESTQNDRVARKSRAQLRRE